MAKLNDKPIWASHLEANGFDWHDAPYTPLKPEWEDFPIIKCIREWEALHRRPYINEESTHAS